MISEFFKKRNAAGNPQLLTSKNIYVLPSKFGWLYAFVTLTLFSAAINYQISTIFLLIFLLVFSGLISAWEAHANLKGLSIKLVAITDASVDEPVHVSLFIQPQAKRRFAIECKFKKQIEVNTTQIPCEGTTIILPLNNFSRGCHPLPPITLSTLFPFGLFYVWAYAYFNDVFYVYPKETFPGYWPSPLASQGSKTNDNLGQDEFYELKQVKDPWSQPNRIAWKIAAKGQGWYHKTMANPEGNLWRFRLNDLPAALDLETKLQYLSYWIQNAERQGYTYSLDLGHESSDFSQGEAHLKHCLRQLAAYS